VTLLFLFLCSWWWRGFAEFGRLRAIWTKLKVHLTSNWLRFRILGMQTSICVCWLHSLLLGWWGLRYLFESCAWFNLLLLCGGVIDFFTPATNEFLWLNMKMTMDN